MSSEGSGAQPIRVIDVPATKARHGRQRRSHPMRTATKWIALTLASVLVAGVALAGYTFLRLRGEVQTVDIAGPDAAPLPALSEMEGGFNILVVGSDSREGQASAEGDGWEGGELNDVTMLLHVSEDHQSATVISFPRDLLVDLPQCTSIDEETGEEVTYYEEYGQINAALSRGGLGCVVDTVEYITGLEIPFAGMIGFDGVIRLSTAVGGVDICATGDIYDPYTGLQLYEGGNTVMGAQALALLRSRHGVGDGSDLGRISAQQVFLAALIRKLQSDAVLTDLPTMYQIAGVVTESMVLSDSLADPNRIVEIARVLAKIPLDTMTFVQFPTYYEGSRVVPNQVAADALWALIAADQPVLPDPEVTGEASVDPNAPVTDPTVPDETPDPIVDPETGELIDPVTGEVVVPDPAATPDPTSPSVVPDLAGQTASQQTCLVPYYG